MIKLLGIFFLFFITIRGNVNAQDLGSVSGMVKDEMTGDPVDFAAVSIYKEGSDVATKNYMTDIEGNFLFTDLPFGVYKIKISFIGYKTKLIEGITINKDQANKNLLDVKLSNSENNTLQEVVVTETKPVIEFGADTITFNVSQSIQAEGSTASDLLKSVPMVTVDIDGKPTIAGKNNTRIFIDGKPSDFTAETMTDLLNILPSDAILKIEVITNPEVQYSADGDGIINIVLKKGYQIGLNGALSFTAGTIGNYNTSLYTAYSNKKISLTNTYGFKDARVSSNVSTLRSNFKNEAIDSYMNQYSNALNKNHGHNLRSAVNWDITPKQNLRFSANYNNSGNSGASHLDDYRLNAQEVQRELRIQDSDNGNKSANLTLNADYKFNISKKNESLTAGIVWFNNSSERDRLLSRLYHKPNGTTSNAFEQQNNNDIGNNRLELNVDYIRPLSKLTSVTLGSQVTIGNNGNNQFVQGYDFITQQDTVIPSLTNNFEYQERIYAFYGSYRLRTKTRWSLRGGIRSEFTDISFKEASLANNSPKPYHNLFPNISINKLYKKKYNFGLSYSMRINRPRENALNPLIDNSNQSNVSFGNPDLKPSYSNQFQLSFGTYGLKWSFTPRISYATTERIIERYRISSDSVTYENLGSNKALTFGVFGNYRPTKVLTLTGGYTLSKRDYESKSALQPSRTGYSHRLNLNLTGNLPYKISCEGQINYTSNAIAQGRTTGSVNTSFGLRKNFFNNKVMMRVMAADPFTQQNSMEFIEAFTPSGFYSQERNRTVNTRNYSVTLSYRFTNTRKKLDEHMKKEEVKK